MSYDYDLLVIGAGSGGLAAAKRAASYGAKVAVIESDLVGGTCVVRGCVPKKLLVYASKFSQLDRDRLGYGWEAVESKFHWPTLAEIVDREVNRLSQLHISFLDKSEVELLRGQASFLDPHTLVVGDRKHTAERILIATGSEAILPEVPGIEHAITSREVFKLPEQPKRLAIIGGGYIGIEFAGVFNGLGTEVFQIVRGETILRGFDTDIRNHVQAAATDRGVNILTSTTVERIEKTPDGTILHLNHDGVTKQLTVDAAVLFAIGRAPNIAGLNLEGADVEIDRGAVAVDAASQTNQPHIYAVGDVTNRANLTPVAIDEGRAFADTVYGNKPRNVNYDNIPTAVFSQPEAATVGLSEAEAVARYGTETVQIFRSVFRPMFNTLAGSDEKTLMKLVVDRQSDRVLGAHMVGSDAAEIIQTAAIALNMGATKEDFDNTMALHPSAAEEFVTMR